MATTTTHDLPTVAGWWQGRDIDWRAQVGLFAPAGSEHADRAERHEDRQRMWAAFRHARIAADAAAPPANDATAPRSEERRAGQEGVRTCRSRWAPPT